MVLCLNLTAMAIPQLVADTLQQITTSPWLLLTLVMLVILVCGLFAAVYGVARLITHTVELPGYVRAFRERRRGDQAGAAL